MAIRALHESRATLGDEDSIAELVAYAADPVRQAVGALLAEVNEQWRWLHFVWLIQLKDIEEKLATQPEPERQESGAIPMTPTNLEIFAQWQSLRRAELQALDKIGNQSNLDVDQVIGLCDKVIEAAREDLRGRYGND